MKVRTLEMWPYESNGRRLKPVKIDEPTWAEIEAAIRQLDGLKHPILFLWANADPALQMMDEFSERLEVLGGAGVYWVAGTFQGYFQRQLLDPTAGLEDVELYPPSIEQGFGAPARHITRDVAQVLEVSRYYADQGGFDPSASWEDDRLIGGVPNPHQ